MDSPVVSPAPSQLLRSLGLMVPPLISQLWSFQWVHKSLVPHSQSFPLEPNVVAAFLTGPQQHSIGKLPRALSVKQNKVVEVNISRT